MEPVAYDFDGTVATITMDDGKVNALSLTMQSAIREALDRAEADDAAVVLTGREGRFSAGFDLAVLSAGGEDALRMLRGGFELAERLLSFPRPVVIACNGHAVAMGVFLLTAGDYRIGVAGPFKITANEVAIGMTLPWAAIELCRQRLSPAHFNRALVLAEVYAPGAAINAGFLDQVVQPEELQRAAHEAATAMAGLNPKAHKETKLRVRADALAALRKAIEADDAALRASA